MPFTTHPDFLRLRAMAPRDWLCSCCGAARVLCVLSWAALAPTAILDQCLSLMKSWPPYAVRSMKDNETD
eukprot:7231067-Heterocapsa_arctica.AAC.1